MAVDERDNGFVCVESGTILHHSKGTKECQWKAYPIQPERCHIHLEDCLRVGMLTSDELMMIYCKKCGYGRDSINENTMNSFWAPKNSEECQRLIEIPTGNNDGIPTGNNEQIMETEASNYIVSQDSSLTNKYYKESVSFLIIDAQSIISNVNDESDIEDIITALETEMTGLGRDAVMAIQLMAKDGLKKLKELEEIGFLKKLKELEEIGSNLDLTFLVYFKNGEVLIELNNKEARTLIEGESTRNNDGINRKHLRKMDLNGCIFDAR